MITKLSPVNKQKVKETLQKIREMQGIIGDCSGYTKKRILHTLNTHASHCERVLLFNVDDSFLVHEDTFTFIDSHQQMSYISGEDESSIPSGWYYEISFTDKNKVFGENYPEDVFKLLMDELTSLGFVHYKDSTRQFYFNPKDTLKINKQIVKVFKKYEDMAALEKLKLEVKFVNKLIDRLGKLEGKS